MKKLFISLLILIAVSGYAQPPKVDTAQKLVIPPDSLSFICMKDFNSFSIWLGNNVSKTAYDKLTPDQVLTYFLQFTIEDWNRKEKIKAMINIPIPFYGMWVILLLGVLTSMLIKIKTITEKTPENVLWKEVIKKFFNREWPSYGISFILTFIIAGSFQYMKRFDNSSNEEISKWAKWIPLAVPILFLLGCVCQWGLYKLLGRIQGKEGEINTDVLKNKE